MKFNVPANPTRKFQSDKTTVLSLRIPVSLLAALKKNAKDKNRSSTEVILMVLDQYLQQEVAFKRNK